MQGVEIVDRLISGGEEITIWRPELVNQRARPRALVSDLG